MVRYLLSIHISGPTEIWCVRNASEFCSELAAQLYHKSKSRYVGPWVVGDALRAKKKLSLVLPDMADTTPHGRTLARQYEHLQKVQQSNFAEVTADLPVAARCKSTFVFRCPDRWRVSAVSDNIYLRDPAHGQDFEPIQHTHDPQGILSRMVGGIDSALFIHEPSMIDEMGRQKDKATGDDDDTLSEGTKPDGRSGKIDSGEDDDVEEMSGSGKRKAEEAQLEDREDKKRVAE